MSLTGGRPAVLPVSTTEAIFKAKEKRSIMFLINRSVMSMFPATHRGEVYGYLQPLKAHMRIKRAKKKQSPNCPKVKRTEKMMSDTRMASPHR